MNYFNESFYKAETELRMGMYTSTSGTIVEEDRIIQDKSGLWLCQSRFYYTDRNYTTEWQTVKIYQMKKEAENYFKEMPDWVKEF